MAAPLSSTARQAVKEEDEGNINIASSGQVRIEQYYKDVRNEVQRLKDLMKSQRATRRAQPARPPPVQQPPPPPPPPPPPHAHRAWTKRPATGPPPGLAGVRQPSQKQHQPQPQPQHAPQPAPNAHFTPVNTSKPPLHPRSSAEPFDTRRAAAKKSSVVCSVCDVRCMSVFHLKQHERGRKHRNKVAYIAGEMNVQCQVCNVHLSSELNVLEHYSGKQHLRRLFLSGANGASATGNQTT